MKTQDIVIETAEIIAVGTELLIGQTLNTNAFYLAKQLNELGINCYHQSVVGDNPDRLFETIESAVKRSDLVITSGGLGPTADDITMATAARVAGQKLELHEEIRDKIVAYFSRTNRIPCESNWKQCMLPENAHILDNNNGTAPGAVMLFPSPVADKAKTNQSFGPSEDLTVAKPVVQTNSSKLKAIACLPGPPDELIPMFENSLRPWISGRTNYRFINRYIHLMGIGESDAEAAIRDLIDSQDNPTIAPYASPGEVCLRLTERLARGQKKSDRLDQLAARVYERLGPYIYEEGQRKLPQIIFEILQSRNETIAFAESCTAGLMSSQFAEIPGASSVFKGSVVSYTNQVKEFVLKVSGEILERDGAVSEKCAIAMAEGAAKLLKTDLGVSVTGIAGPSGGSATKPVGTVFVAVTYRGKTHVKHYQINGNRNRVRRVAALRAYRLAWQVLQGLVSLK